MFSGIHKDDIEEAVRKRDGAWSILEMSWWLSELLLTAGGKQKIITLESCLERGNNNRTKVAMAYGGFKVIFIKFRSGLHLVFSLFLYISSERERETETHDETLN